METVAELDITVAGLLDVLAGAKVSRESRAQTHNAAETPVVVSC
jgi:hypothetical protein